VRSSSAPVGGLNPTTSAARIAASFRIRNPKPLLEELLQVDLIHRHAVAECPLFRALPSSIASSWADPDYARFFVTKNGDMVTELRQLPDWLDFGFINVEAVERYKDNWGLLKV
jgi:hypothetical protein